MEIPGVGRGRGRLMKQDQLQPLRRPGETKTPLSPEIEGLIAIVQDLSIEDPGTSSSVLSGIGELLKACCQDEESLRLVVQCLHDKSLESKQFGMKAASAFAAAASLEISGLKLRNVVLQTIQKDFEERSHLQTSCHLKFLNAIALLGEIFHRVRLPDGSPIIILATAVLQYQDMLLAGDEHEMELFTTQMAVNGRKLYDCQAEELEQLMMRVRTTLMTRNLSGRSRCWLLLALDLAANRYAPLSGELQNFYQMHLGSAALLQLQRLSQGLTVDTSPSSDKKAPVASTAKVEDKQELGDGILKKFRPPSLSSTLNEKNNIENDTKVTNHVKSPVLQENTKNIISRDGVKKSPLNSDPGGESNRKQHISFSNDKKRSGNRKQDGDDIWGSTRGEKHNPWGHDDRFEKDEDFYGKQSQRGEEMYRPRPKDMGNTKGSASKGNWRNEKKSRADEVNPVSSTAASIPLPSSTEEEENWD